MDEHYCWSRSFQLIIEPRAIYVSVGHFYQEKLILDRVEEVLDASDG
jgi:hypothetical protein